MDWHLTIATILVLGSALVALLALGNRVVMIRAVDAARHRAREAVEELARVRKQTDDRQAHDGEMISRLQNRILQQGQMLRSLQEDLDKFIAQHRMMLEMRDGADQGSGPSPQETAAVDQRENAIRERLRNMLQEFRAVTEGLKDSEPPAKAA